ncbi:DUF6342 family protein [Microtetraspora fusca]
MPDIDLGVAADWDEGDTHGRIKLRQNQIYPTSPKKDVLISSPMSIEISVNTNLSSSREAGKIYFTTHHGSAEEDHRDPGLQREPPHRRPGENRPNEHDLRNGHVAPHGAWALVRRLAQPRPGDGRRGR